MKKQSMIKELSHGCLLICLSIIIGFVLCEIILRLFLPQQEAMKWFISDANYGYLLKKNYSQQYHYLGFDFVMDVRINSVGHRYQEYSRSDINNPDVKNVLLIGDSFTFGHGINMEDHFGVLLEEMLNQDGRYVIINTGVGGWGTLQATSYARDNFSEFKPDIVIYTFCGNDPLGDVYFMNKLRDNEKGSFYFPGKLWMKQNTHLYRFLYANFHKSLHQYLLNKKLSDNNQKNLSIDRQSAAIISEEEWDRTLTYLRTFHKDLRNFNPEAQFLIQCSDTLNTNFREHLKLLSNDHSSIYVDLYDETVSLSREERYLPHDPHWSPKFHQTSAKKLYKIISTISDLAPMALPPSRR